MTTQPGLLEEPLPSRHYLEYRLRAGTDAGALRAALAQLPPAADGLQRVVALGPAALALLGTGIELEPFADLAGPEHRAPATQRDVWVGLAAAGVDDVFDAVRATHRALADVAELELDLRGFDYHDSHDLIGFVDGTANPKDEKAVAAAVIADGPGAGGSVLFTQQWVHDMAAFEALPVEAQEQVVGRTKADDVELEGDAMPADSHVSRTDVKVDGVAQKILRRSSPYGDATEHGLYFVAYTCERSRVQVQLERMYGVAGDGLQDRLLGFSRAVNGSYWFAPSVEDLARWTG